MMEFLLRNVGVDVGVLHRHCSAEGRSAKVQGCIEHTGVATQLIQEAHEGKGDLAVLRLNLANAHGPIPHKLN